MQFSVIVPVYNVEKYLPECLDSILAQDFQDFEVLVVDDGSTDSSGSICDEYAMRDSRIRVFHQENQGLSGARNTGLDHAEGTWIVFVDSDDYVAAELLSVLHRNILKTSADMYSYNVLQVSEDGSERVRYLMFSPEYRFHDLHQEQDRQDFFYGHFLRYEYGWEAWNRIYKREIIAANQLRFVPTQEVFAEDMLFAIQYLFRAESVVQIMDFLYFYRLRSSSLMGKLQTQTILPRILRLLEIVYSDLTQYGRQPLMEKQFASLFFVVVNHQVQHNLWQVPITEVRKQLHTFRKNKNYKQWHLSCILNFRRYRRLMGKRKWL